MRTCPNASEAHLMLFRYERRKKLKVDIWKVVGL
jgi:hypothetical protein